MDEVEARRLLDLVVEYVNAAADEDTAASYGLEPPGESRTRGQIAAEFAAAVKGQS